MNAESESDKIPELLIGFGYPRHCIWEKDIRKMFNGTYTFFFWKQINKEELKEDIVNKLECFVFI